MGNIQTLGRNAKHIRQFITSECWYWCGSVSHNGYGQANIVTDGRTKNVRAHRFVYERLVGPIPDGMHLHHTCGFRACVNPAHLVPLTPADNIALNGSPPAEKRRMLICGRCGGEFSVRRDGHRVCVPCKAAYNRSRFADKYHNDPEWREKWKARALAEYARVGRARRRARHATRAVARRPRGAPVVRATGP